MVDGVAVVLPLAVTSLDGTGGARLARKSVMRKWRLALEFYGMLGIFGFCFKGLVDGHFCIPDLLVSYYVAPLLLLGWVVWRLTRKRA